MASRRPSAWNRNDDRIREGDSSDTDAGTDTDTTGVEPEGPLVAVRLNGGAPIIDRQMFIDVEQL